MDFAEPSAFRVPNCRMPAPADQSPSAGETVGEPTRRDQTSTSLRGSNPIWKLGQQTSSTGRGDLRSRRIFGLPSSVIHCEIRTRLLASRRP
jgi:hypothetical protein